MKASSKLEPSDSELDALNQLYCYDITGTSSVYKAEALVSCLPQIGAFDLATTRC